MQANDVIDLALYRAKKYPSVGEVRTHLLEMAAMHDPLNRDIAESLLEMYDAELLQVTRRGDGEFLYALRKDEATNRGPGTVQDIRTAAGYDGVAEENSDKSLPDSNCE